jgi:hypothetical protein
MREWRANAAKHLVSLYLANSCPNSISGLLILPKHDTAGMFNEASIDVPRAILRSIEGLALGRVKMPGQTYFGELLAVCKTLR